MSQKWLAALLCGEHVPALLLTYDASLCTEQLVCGELTVMKKVNLKSQYILNHSKWVSCMDKFLWMKLTLFGGV